MDFDEEIDDMCFLKEMHVSNDEIDGDFPEDDIFDFIDEKKAYGVA